MGNSFTYKRKKKYDLKHFKNKLPTDLFKEIFDFAFVKCTGCNKYNYKIKINMTKSLWSIDYYNLYFCSNICYNSSMQDVFNGKISYYGQTAFISGSSDRVPSDVAFIYK